ncbi:uncharacterized protein BDZ83DRAFT_647483 [Colletotrichum acutatum]|uniref:Uncharacterized protein n=1 Tax=Glomerella acutata TaxID=27357 RepID=A0AAD8XM99_GLOAC|nr:uncharacterized protein BDZ83DRAFT_647483 [Colletotrichum acutatum]KAK1729927.1 hypothetical protein BDZ83DRAFT_647483 [Colletotrichum acutatum]
MDVGQTVVVSLLPLVCRLGILVGLDIGSHRYRVEVALATIYLCPVRCFNYVTVVRLFIRGFTEDMTLPLQNSACYKWSIMYECHTAEGPKRDAGHFRGATNSLGSWELLAS